ncbi:4'-phosphopantetheinyl transferase superfamily protein [Paenibacillus pseudetheri]|uniref:4'-phosphopantetheinyl transferase domain-containing protein n=1 Tax=Paenibacillus pseudetheri TaxID=2897682 RepID=A0ABM9BGZ0_9BACL|nr:4'-phosphopantetheinyl transferase superfamily protein [Paenibacillus pseudetheri]CAH1058196.1 hypothetical protein PAECIP111894_04369 [Paenibacillus pseudetheri]
MRVTLIKMQPVSLGAQVVNFEGLKYQYTSRQFKKLRRKFLLDMLKKKYDDLVELDFVRRRISFDNQEELNYSYSLSGYNIAVIVNKSPIGIDIESYEKLRDCVLDIYASREEIEAIQSALQTDCSKQLRTFLWCSKESIGKLISVGLKDGYKAIQFSNDDGLRISSIYPALPPSIYIYYCFLPYYCVVISSFREIGGIESGDPRITSS